MGEAFFPPALFVRFTIRNEDEDEIIHTNETPYCDDMTCPCHEVSIEDLEREFWQSRPALEGAIRPAEYAA